MKVLLNIALGEIPNRINRQVEVDENISLKDLCEFIIVSMNGSKIPMYELNYKNVIYYPYLIKETKKEKNLENLILKDLKLKKDISFILEYNFEYGYYFDIVADNIYESKDKTIFKVLSGNGYGVLDDLDLFWLKKLFDLREDRLKKSEKEYLEKKFDCIECNERITNYINDRIDRLSPKRYVFNVSLYGFEKEIKRKIVVNNNILIEDFCMMVILAMNGDLSHLYGIKIGKQYLSEYFNDLELYYLNLKEKQKFKIVYDMGDNWIFNLTLSKIIDEYGDNEFEVIAGKGYGIIDDVGGIWGLENIFSGRDTSWGKYNIDDFDLEECNENIKKIN